MNKPYELNYTELKPIYNEKSYKFNTTLDLDRDYDIIGQERASKAFEFGLRVNNYMYNIYICGIRGTGRTSYAIEKAKEFAKSRECPDDWCYVYNFKRPERPIALNLPNGLGKEFQKDMKELIKKIIKSISYGFMGKDYEKGKNKILESIKKRQNELMEFLYDFSQGLDFEVIISEKGLVFTPMKDGKPINDEEFNKLDDYEKKKYEESAEKIQSKSLEILKEIKVLEKEGTERLKDYKKEMVTKLIHPIFDELINKYMFSKKILEYLEDVEKDVIDNLWIFETLIEKEISLDKVDLKDIFPKYHVNLFVDNSNLRCAPVIIECNPTYNNLVGFIEYENDNGKLKTDFTKVRAGSLHRANGGYIVIQADQLLRNEFSWPTLKRVLTTKEIKIENLRRQLDIADISSLNPESIPIDVKVILIGNPMIYSALSFYDEDFEKLFKIKVDFDVVMENTLENQVSLAKFIGTYCKENNLRPLDKMGVIRIFEYSNRLAGSQIKLSTRFNKIAEILIEADVWAGLMESKVIRESHIYKAIQEKKYRHNRVEEILEDMYKKGKYIIAVDGYRIGQINGLSVINLGDYEFGKPNVITVSTFSGDKGVINVEREVELSGSIFDKGVIILEGYLNTLLCKEEPLSLTVQICFEQSYNGIDGDSASSAELYGVLSSIGEIPLRQDIAVTGSINQKGDIQPVGGISEKVEGFFKVCKCLGLTGKQGVIIPIQNTKDLVLEDEVVEAVKKGYFHIYAISNVREGFEIMTGISFENALGIIKEKLKEYRNKMKNKR